MRLSSLPSLSFAGQNALFHRGLVSRSALPGVALRMPEIETARREDAFLEDEEEEEEDVEEKAFDLECSDGEC